MKLTILAEGSTKWQRFTGHWGLSILIDDSILFDTFGDPNYVSKQFDKFGLDINKVKRIIISHDDWDHVSGLWKILERDSDAAVYICPNSNAEIKTKIKSYGARYVEVNEPTEIKKDIYVSGELTGGSRRGMTLPEQYAVIKTSKGIVVVTGCAHPGIVEIVQHAKANFNENINLLIGGFHLKDNPDKINSEIIKKIKKLGVRQIAPLHCTGKLAQNIMIQEYGSKCIVLNGVHAIDV